MFRIPSSFESSINRSDESEILEEGIIDAQSHHARSRRYDSRHCVVCMRRRDCERTVTRNDVIKKGAFIDVRLDPPAHSAAAIRNGRRDALRLDESTSVDLRKRNAIPFG